MSNALTTIDFHGAQLIAIAGDRPENTLVAMKPIVEGMGLDWSYQYRKLSSHPVLSSCIAVTATQIPGDDQVREHTFLALEKMNFWLATIHPDRIKDTAVRAKVIDYQTECARVLFNHFFGKVIATGMQPHVSVVEIERRVMAAIGGTLKGIVLKQIGPKIDALEQKVDNALSSCDPSSGFAVNFRPMRWFVEQAGVEQHGRRPLICAMSRRCLSWLIRNNMGENIRCSRDASRQLFQVDAVKRWMKAEGATMIQTHKDKMFGQGRLGMKRRKKGALELALHPFDPAKVQ